MNILVVAPHPDDETFGCGGALLKHLSDGDKIHWIVLTKMTEDSGYTIDRIKQRTTEIENVAKYFKFTSVNILNYPAAKLDTLPLSDIIMDLSYIFKRIEPSIVYLPNRSDVHTDHSVGHDAAAACCKWFKCPSIKKILAYETVSETDFGLYPKGDFRPNYYVDITGQFDSKVQAATMYGEELGDAPFPRSLENMKALATFRGSTAGVRFAEAFMLLKEIC